MRFTIRGALLLAAAAIAFASIYIVPAADSSSAPKAWAHGVSYVLPRLMVADFLAFCAAIVFARGLGRTGHDVASYIAWFFVVVLSFPWVLALLFFVRVLFV